MQFKKYCIPETPTLSTAADRSTDTNKIDLQRHKRKNTKKGMKYGNHLSFLRLHVRTINEWNTCYVGTTYDPNLEQLLVFKAPGRDNH